MLLSHWTVKSVVLLVYLTSFTTKMEMETDQTLPGRKKKMKKEKKESKTRIRLGFRFSLARIPTLSKASHTNLLSVLYIYEFRERLTVSK